MSSGFYLLCGPSKEDVRSPTASFRSRFSGFGTFPPWLVSFSNCGRSATNKCVKTRWAHRMPRLYVACYDLGLVPSSCPVWQWLAFVLLGWGLISFFSASLCRPSAWLLVCLFSFYYVILALAVVCWTVHKPDAHQNLSRFWSPRKSRILIPFCRWN